MEILSKLYAEVNKDSVIIEIIYINFDHSLEEFNEIYSQMNWIGIPFEDPRCKAISEKYGVKSIPHLTVLRGSDGKLIKDNARVELTEKGPEIITEWLTEIEKEA